MNGDAGFTNERVQSKIKETLDWIYQCQVDAILITCTFFTANLQQEDIRSYAVPIIKIDEPLFLNVCELNQPFIMVFTNPNTVEGTMGQLHQLAASRGKVIQAESALLEHTFDLIMQGNKKAYMEAVTAGLQQMKREHPEKQVYAAQLSMVPAAESVGVGSQLQSLAAYMQDKLSLVKVL
ncbi:hypothetical protein D3C73_713620 [compost metagenome]